jgi:hypothetical protein
MTEEYTRADDLWFFDGSLVIKTGQKVFRVYKAQLAARSTVFAAMTTLETPQNQGDEFIDGVPVVVLHDAADDVHVFLRAIFDSRYGHLCGCLNDVLISDIAISCLSQSPRF